MAEDRGKPRLSRTEWRLMLVLWRLGKPSSASEVLGSLAPEDRRDFRTIQVVLNRCVEKGYCRRARRTSEEIEEEKREGAGRPRLFFYSPNVEQEDAMRERIDHFLEESLEYDLENLELLRKRVLQVIDEVKAGLGRGLSS